METPNVVLMQQAREALSGRWGLAIGTFVVYGIIVGGIGIIPGASLLIAGPFALGMAHFSMSISRKQDAKLEQIFSGFNRFGTSLGAYLLMMIFILLWSLLFIIPGIIAGLSYSMTFFLLADHPTMGASEAIDESKRMMDGHKMKLFRLSLRLFGLALLCILTLGIGFFWLMPFAQVCMVEFYEDLKGTGDKEADISDHILVPEIF